MESYIKSMDKLGRIVKIILALPCILDISWGIYRLFKAYLKHQKGHDATFDLVIAVLSIILFSIMGFVDIVFIALGKGPFEIEKIA